MKHLFVALFLSALIPQSLWAQETFEEISYEDLLQELSIKTEKAAPIRRSQDFFGSVLLHAGFGIINSQIGLEVEGDHFFRHKNGFQMAVGIDLATPEWQLEGAVRNYGHAEDDREHYSLREFDLRVVHQKRVGNQLGVRMGGGLAARYLNYQKTVTVASAGEKATPEPVGDNPSFVEETPAPTTRKIDISNSTPSAIAFVGFDYYATQTISLGVDLNARSSLIADTSDRFALDMTFRIDTHF